MVHGIETSAVLADVVKAVSKQSMKKDTECLQDFLSGTCLNRRMDDRGNRNPPIREDNIWIRDRTNLIEVSE